MLKLPIIIIAVAFSLYLVHIAVLDWARFSQEKSIPIDAKNSLILLDRTDEIGTLEPLEVDEMIPDAAELFGIDLDAPFDWDSLDE